MPDVAALALDDEEREMWAVCAHEAGHAVAVTAAGLGVELMTAEAHTPWLGEADSSGWTQYTRYRSWDAVPDKLVPGMQVASAAGGVAETMWRTDALGWSTGQAIASTWSGCGGDREISAMWLARPTAISEGEAERRAETLLDGQWERVLDLAERLNEADGRLGSWLFNVRV